MNGRYILNESHELVPCPDLMEWGRWMQDDERRRVAAWEQDGVRVSTVFLGLDHSFMPGAPVVFETMVFGGTHDGDQERYHTWDEAQAGHDAIVARVQGAPSKAPDPDPVALESLVGEHELSGVDFESVLDAPANSIRFVLDGRIYVATEDENDGYRSSMESLVVVDGPPVANTFPPTRVVVSHITAGEYDTNDYLAFTDIANGQVVLEVGTENISDYYPGFVNHFYPDRLAVNAAKGGA